MSSAAALPDGRIMFLRWDSEDFTSSMLYEMQTDLATGAIQANREGRDPGGDDTTTLQGLSVSANGKQALVLHTIYAKWRFRGGL